jgi:S-formylglutathione hydrolase FrmB
MQSKKPLTSDTTVRTLPAEYTRAAKKEQQGSVLDVSYPVRNYIDASRQLVTDRQLDSRHVGRGTGTGEAIQKSCHVYLPAGYDEHDRDTRYDVLYLLHGVGGDQGEWLQASGGADDHPILCHILDNLIANNDIAPLIVVFPNGRSTHDWTDRSFRTEGTNMLGFYYFDYELRHDLIPFIETTFNTYADVRQHTDERIRYNRKHRAIAGLSMGGMQCLNLVLGGYRCDADLHTGASSGWGNGLSTTVLAPGMTDLFADVGVFSNAPTSSDGNVLGDSIASGGYPLRLLYMTCGDEDGVSMNSYASATAGLADQAKDRLRQMYQVLIHNGVHDFGVWNNGAYNFLRLAFADGGEDSSGQQIVKLTLPSG